MATLKCSSSCKEVRNPIKLSSECSTERYLMRQRYLRSYPLKIAEKKETLAANAARRTKKWIKEKQRKYCRVCDQENNEQTGLPRGDKKANPGFYYVEACLKSLLGCVAKVDAVSMENPKPTGFGTMKLQFS